MEGQSFGDMPAQRACPKKIIQLCVTMIPAWPHFTLYNDTHTCHFGQRGYDLSWYSRFCQMAGLWFICCHTPTMTLGTESHFAQLCQRKRAGLHWASSLFGLHGLVHVEPGSKYFYNAPTWAWQHEEIKHPIYCSSSCRAFQASWYFLLFPRNHSLRLTFTCCLTGVIRDPNWTSPYKFDVSFCIITGQRWWTLAGHQIPRTWQCLRSLLMMQIADLLVSSPSSCTLRTCDMLGGGTRVLHQLPMWATRLWSKLKLRIWCSRAWWSWCKQSSCKGEPIQLEKNVWESTWLRILTPQVPGRWLPKSSASAPNNEHLKIASHVS